ncbi:MAG: peptidylprolyl isomerase [Caulobacterales bacterium]|nr:peptidylprolyl isomerase [Caulobacterales bacterium]
MTRYPKGMAAMGAGLACALAALSAAPSSLAQETAQPISAPVAAGPRANGFSETVAAVVNDDIVSTYDLAQRMRLLIATSGIQPTQENLAEFQHEALVSLVDERLQFQELHRVEKEQKMEIVADDSEVNEEIDGMAQQNNMSRDQFLGYLASRGIGPETLKQQLRAQISWARWIRGRYGSRLRIGEDQIAATQARLAAESAKPQYNIGEVLIDASRVGGMDQAMKGAQQLVTQMQQGAPFPAVARQFSALPTAANGGDAGWVTEGDMPREVQAVVEQMRPGQLSQPIQVKDGVYILYLKEKRAGGASTMVSLKQVAIALPQTASADDEAAAKAKLVALKPQLKGCTNLEAIAGKTEGVVAGDLGEAELGDLAPQFRDAAEKLKVGEISDPVRTTAGLHLVAVCARRSGGQGQADKQQIEQRLYSQQLSMIARRYMRDLRNSATIETR